MFLDNDNKDYSNFLAYFDNELSDLQYLDEVEKIIKKYDIVQNEDEFISSIEINCLYIINYVNSLAFKQIKIPQDLQNIILNNPAFIDNTNLILKKKIFNLTINDSISFSRDLTSILNILSAGIDDYVLYSYNNINFEALTKLLRFYENRILSLHKENNELFDSVFYSYFILLNALDKICILNSVVVTKKNVVNQIIEQITESINILKFSILFNDKKLDLLNFIQGKLLYSYSHKHFFHFKIENLEDSIEEYVLYMHRLEDGYLITKNSHFTNDEEIDIEKEFQLFQNNFALLVLDLISKIKKSKVNEESIFFKSFFQKIVKFYYDKFTIQEYHEYNLKSLDEFKAKILDLLIYNYSIRLETSKNLDHTTILNDFIFSDKEFKNSNLETVYKILLHSENIEDYKFFNIGQILVRSTAVKNDYYEFFKILIFNLIIENFTDKKIDFEIENLINDILKYIDKYKNSSHLLPHYFQIYLSLSLFYLKHQISIKKARNLYFVFAKVNSIDLLNEHYMKINDEILEIENDIINQHNSYYDLEEKENIQNYFDSIKNELNQNNLSNLENLYENLERFISNEIFYGISKINIININNIYIKDIDIAHRELIINIDENHSLQFIYPYTYERSFKEILSENEIQIKSNLSEIFHFNKN